MRLKQFISLRYEIFQMNSDSINHLYFRWLLKKCRWKTLNRIRTNDQTQAEINEPEPVGTSTDSDQSISGAEKWEISDLAVHRSLDSS